MKEGDKRKEKVEVCGKSRMDIGSKKSKEKRIDKRKKGVERSKRGEELDMEREKEMKKERERTKK